MHLFSFKPKNKFSIENLKYLYGTLSKNRTITSQNKNLIVETLRQIAEVLIWGDQHNTGFFDFFLEKNLVSFFLNILDQKCSTEVIIQLLQTLSILVENLKTQNSIYFLLSNNYINEIIIHKFDFSCEEVLDYYISFLKALSLKVDKNTVNFFFNGQEKDFPLYTEAIKFSGNKETMIRIAVRTLTLNIFKVEDEELRSYIINSTAVPYFSNIVWFIRKECIQLNEVLENSSHSKGIYNLNYSVEELTDQFYYLHDIFNLGFESMNIVLAEQFIQYLVFPVLIGSLLDPSVENSQIHSQPEDRITPTLALFLLSQVFHIFTYKPLLDTVANAMLTTSLNQSLLFLSTNSVPPPPPLSSIGTQRKHYNSFRRIASFPNLDSLDSSKSLSSSSPSTSTNSPKSSNNSKKDKKDKNKQESTSENKPIPQSTQPPKDSLHDPNKDDSTTNTEIPTTVIANSVEANLAVSSIHNALTSSTDSSLSLELNRNNNNHSSFSTTSQTNVSTFSNSSNTSSTTNNYKFTKFQFKESLLKFIQNDRETFGVVVMLYSFLKNTNIEKKILEMGGILPYRMAKAKKLLEGLLSPDSRSPSTTSPIKKKNDSNKQQQQNGKSSPVNTNGDGKGLDMSTSLPIGLGLSTHIRSKSESHASIFSDLDSDDISASLPLSTLFKSSPTNSVFKSRVVELSSSCENSPVSGTSPTNSVNSNSSIVSTEKIMNQLHSSASRIINSTSSSINSNNTRVHTPPRNNNNNHNNSEEEEQFIPYPESGQTDFTRNLVNKLFYILVNSNQFRLVTLQMTLLLLKELVYTPESQSKLTENQLQLLEHAYNNACRNLKECLNGNLSEVFLEIFEEEIRSYKQIYFESLIKDVALILPVPETPISRLSLARRLPSGEAEKTQKAIQQFLVLRELKYTLLRQKDTMLPLKQPSHPMVKENDVFLIDNDSFDVFEYHLVTESQSSSQSSSTSSTNNTSGKKKSSKQYGVLFHSLLLTIEPKESLTTTTTTTTTAVPTTPTTTTVVSTPNKETSTPSTPNKFIDPLSPLSSTPNKFIDPLSPASNSTNISTSSSPMKHSGSSTVNNGSNTTTTTTGNYGNIIHIAPLQKLEIEVSHLDPCILRVTSHLTTWNIEMGFDSESSCLKAKQLLERAVDDVRANKMRQIYNLLGEKDPYNDDSIERLNQHLSSSSFSNNQNNNQHEEYETLTRVIIPVDADSHPLTFNSDELIDLHRYHQSINNAHNNNNNNNNNNNSHVQKNNKQKKRNSSSSTVSSISTSTTNTLELNDRIEEIKSMEKKRNSIERKGDIFSSFFDDHNNDSLKSLLIGTNVSNQSKNNQGQSQNQINDGDENNTNINNNNESSTKQDSNINLEAGNNSNNIEENNHQ